MANTDPVSGLMASMARVRNRRPDGTASMASTAEQASTVLPQPKAPEPASFRPQPSSFEQVLPGPQAAPMAPAQPTTPLPPENPPMGLTGPSEEDPKAILTRVTGELMDSGDGYDLADAYILGLGYLYGIPK